MKVQSIYNNIKIISIAMEEIISNSELAKPAYKEKIDYNGILIKLLTKYLSFYNQETQYDLLMDMFSNIFVTKLRSIEKSYDKSQPLYSFLYTIMKNEIIQLSKALTAKNSNVEDLTLFEDESLEDGWERLVQGTSSCSCPKSLSKEEEEMYMETINDYTKLKYRILNEELEVENVEKSVSIIDSKIEKIRTEMQRINGFHRTKYRDNSHLQIDYESIRQAELDESLNPFIEDLKNKLRAIKTSYRGKINRPWAGDRMKFLDMILADFNFSECAIFFEVSPTSTNKWANQIKEALFQLADDYEFNNNDDSLVLKLNEWLDDLESDNKVNRSKSDGCPKALDKCQLYKQIIAVFGVDFMNMEDN